MSGSGTNGTALGVIIIFALLVIYIAGGSFIEHKHYAVGHETTVALLFGLLISVITFVWTDLEELRTLFTFNGSVFFFLCLPPIIFASGFNMRRRKFFANLGYIMLFGLVGTVITFMAFSLLTWGFMESGMMWKYQLGKE